MPKNGKSTTSDTDLYNGGKITNTEVLYFMMASLLLLPLKLLKKARLM